MLCRPPIASAHTRPALCLVYASASALCCTSLPCAASHALHAVQVNIETKGKATNTQQEHAGVRAGTARELPLPETGHFPSSSREFKQSARLTSSTLPVSCQPYPNAPCALAMHQSARCTRNIPLRRLHACRRQYLTSLLAFVTPPRQQATKLPSSTSSRALPANPDRVQARPSRCGPTAPSALASSRPGPH